MTILRQSAMRELERLPEDKITFVLQIMRGINGLDEDERLAKKNALLSICEIFDIIGIDKTKLIIGLENEDFSDFEDCLQMECARDYGAKYIVTRNIADYEKSEIKAISPSDFLKGELMH